jgi:predicted ATPase/DNA-binding winged helix-turn-helix (wHTH) protein
VSGDWEIDLVRHELRAQGVAVPIGSRAFAIIEMLVQSGKLVTKDELMARVWSGAIVEDNTVQVHISAIRKALGADRGMLKTVSGRGYRLSGSWTVRQESSAAEPDAPEGARVAEPSFLTNVPVAASALIGRESAVQYLCDLVSAYRVVTLAGLGGIGKTVLAAEVARRLFPTLEGDVLFVELVSLSDPSLVPSATASSLGLKLGGEISPESVARAIGGKRLLLVLDNCEHVVDAAAGLAETVVRLCSRASILATSREVLRIEGEHVYHVPPLDVPPPHSEDSAGVLEHSAAQLFVTRTKSVRADFSVQEEALPVIAAICRRLDGIPLAIEFAAARAATLGVRQVAGHLDDRFSLLAGGRRTALLRHRTLRATLDWSHDLLPEPERRLLRHLAIFPAGFTLEAAAAVMSDLVSGVAVGISNLISKSMVTLDGSTSARRWRLLETIRAYALEKLDDGERKRVALRHAEYYRDLFARAEAEALARPAAEWLADYAPEIDNLRSALDWAFSPGGGDIAVGNALTAAAVPLWVYLSLIEECRRRVERALAGLAAVESADERLEMKLQAALGASLAWIGRAAVDTESAWTRTLRLAERLGDIDYQLRSLWGLWLISDREAVELAQQFGAVASTPTDRLIADKMIGYSYHYRGNQSASRRHLERVIADDASPDPGHRLMRFHLDQRPASILARVLWLRGLPEQAMAMAERLVAQERGRDHANSLCHALGWAACPIALWMGNLELAEHYIDLLHETSSKHELTFWHAVSRAHRGVHLIKRGDQQVGLPRLRAAFEECRAVPAGYRFMFIAELPEALAPGQISGGLARMEEAIDRAERTAEGWIMPELLRVKGELLRLNGAPNAADSGEGCFLQALQLARSQEALSWELRAATSLATLYRTQGRSADSVACLQPVYERFTEGFDSADLIMAKRLLDGSRPTE